MSSVLEALLEEASVQTVEASALEAGEVFYTPLDRPRCRPGFMVSPPDDDAPHNRAPDVAALDDVVPDNGSTPVVSPHSADAGPTGYLTDSDGEEHAACLPTLADEEAPGGGASIAQLPDVTVLIEDNAGVPSQAAAPQLQEPVLSFVSVNPQTAASFDVLRGSLTVLPELPSAISGSSSSVRTLRVSCGRDPANTVVLRDSRISQRHFTLRVRAAADGVVALDIHDQSSNGTFVNGRRVGRGRRQPIVVGDRIVALPAEQAGRDEEVGFQLLHDTKGAACCSSTRGAIIEDTEAKDAKEEEEQKPGVPKALEKDLQCGVCTDVFYRCLTLVPCGHNFCSACFLRWRHQSSGCPGCRGFVRQAVRNQDIDRMVETFVQGHPALARSPAELQQMLALERKPENDAMLRWLVKGPRIPMQRQPHGELTSVATPQRQRAHQPPQRAAPSSVCVVS